MARNTKIATCCYCGSRAALVLSGKERHELTCATCGAPLHMMKRLHPAEPRPAIRKQRPANLNPALFAKSKPKKKKRKSLMRRVMSELEDVIEDIFD